MKNFQEVEEGSMMIDGERQFQQETEILVGEEFKEVFSVYEIKSG